jgi:hypothetical protein
MKTEDCSREESRTKKPSRVSLTLVGISEKS